MTAGVKGRMHEGMRFQAKPKQQPYHNPPGRLIRGGFGSFGGRPHGALPLDASWIDFHWLPAACRPQVVLNDAGCHRDDVVPLHGIHMTQDISTDNGLTPLALAWDPSTRIGVGLT